VSARYRLESIFAIACALARFAVCCYRAVHQSIIVDEATTYNKFVSGPWLKLFGRYDANNHILSSIMIKLSVTFGTLSPFKVRLPSLIAGFFLTVGVFWLLKRIQSWPLRWAAFALVCLNPLIFDFSIAARGYSLSLAFFVWGLYFCMEKRYLAAGALLGLSFASNVAILFPILALLAAVVLLDRQIKPLLSLILPAILLAAPLTYPSLRRAHKTDFYTGYPDFRTAVASLASTSLHARADRDGILGDRNTAEKIGIIAVPIFLLLIGAAAFFAKDRRQLIPFLTLAITIFGLILARWLFDLSYPSDRTCLYFIILAAVAWAIAGDTFNSRALQAIWLLPAILLAIQFSTQLQMQYFQFWRVETDDRLIAGLIRQASAGKPENSMTLSASWMHQPTLEFYRGYLHITALKPVERFDPTPLTGFDFYLLSWGDVERAKQANLHTIFTDPDAEVMLATSSAASREGN
jgi:4-amino-4-deoxy-L-arabinose transferase-like glycosyltransferase